MALLWVGSGRSGLEDSHRQGLLLGLYGKVCGRGWALGLETRGGVRNNTRMPLTARKGSFSLPSPP